MPAQLRKSNTLPQGKQGLSMEVVPLVATENARLIVMQGGGGGGGGGGYTHTFFLWKSVMRDSSLSKAALMLSPSSSRAKDMLLSSSGPPSSGMRPKSARHDSSCVISSYVARKATLYTDKQKLLAMQRKMRRPNRCFTARHSPKLVLV